MSFASSWIEEFFSWLWWSCWSLILVEQSVNYFEVLITFWNILRNWNLWKILDPPLFTLHSISPTPPPPPSFLSFSPKFWNGWIRGKKCLGYWKSSYRRYLPGGLLCSLLKKDFVKWNMAFRAEFQMLILVEQVLWHFGSVKLLEQRN